MNFPYSMVIRWSDADQVYIAHLVEFGDGAKTHGATYEEAAKNGREVLEMLIEDYLRSNEKPPAPDKYVDEMANGTAEQTDKNPRLKRRITPLKGNQKHAIA